MKTKDNLKKITLMLKIINEKLLNKDLKEYIFDKFECISNKKFEIINITNNSLKTIGNEDNKFEITFEPDIKNFSKISTIYTSHNEHRKETKELLINENDITLEERKFKIYTQDGEPYSIKKGYEIYKYKNNSLTYSYTFNSCTGIDNVLNSDGTTVEEMYIFPDSSAIKFMSTTAEKDYFGIVGTRYLKTSNYGKNVFDTSTDSSGIKIYNFEEISEKEFQKYLNNWEEEIKVKIKN